MKEYNLCNNDYAIVAMIISDVNEFAAFDIRRHYV
jgi:hypothetical protein